MKTKILTVALLFSMINVANAGFFDFLFSSDDAPVEEVVAVKAPIAPTTTSISSSLLQTLTQQLGVTQTQAEGGMGSLMQLAKSGLSSNEFGQLSSNVPDMGKLLSAAPILTSEDSSAGLSDMLSGAGDIGSSIAMISMITQQFEALGLSSELISKFADIAITYFTKESGTSTGALLQKGLSSILSK